LTLVNSPSRHLCSSELDELALTTNGLQLEKYSRDLVAAGTHRLNISPDTLNARKFWRALKSRSTWLPQHNFLQ
jgi:cyclic pyranopterin phosphate synthase